MKTFLLFLFAFCSAIVFGQKQEEKNAYETDTPSISNDDYIKIIDCEISDINNNSMPIFVNGKRYSMSFFACLDISKITSLVLSAKDTVIDYIRYSHKEIMYITTRDDYKMKPVTLEYIKELYTSKYPTVVLINNDIIIGELSDYFLDENAIARIFRGRIHSLAGIYYLNILTKNEEKKRKADEKRRGTRIYTLGEEFEY